MADIIPLIPELLRYEVDITVEGVPLVIDVEWRPRVESWYLGILTPDREPIVVGRRVVTGWFPFARTVDARLPGGLFLVYRIGDSDDDPGETELGTEVVLSVLTEDERAELAAAAAPNLNEPRRVVIS